MIVSLVGAWANNVGGKVLKSYAVLQMVMGVLFSIAWIWYVVAVTVLDLITKHHDSSARFIHFVSVFNAMLTMLCVGLEFVLATLAWKASSSPDPEQSTLVRGEVEKTEPESSQQIKSPEFTKNTENKFEDEAIFTL
eukprot:TRINITY_DN3601_c0_g1_i11.p1 TRINITY_DN3601_c0_g1~~TRINITY_DN3601_c0_g1_i11.p1  ORF type:complete len:137 (+),score=29.76 TRINITY_DN3601_c0_g1_i11:293-703(+)